MCKALAASFRKLRHYAQIVCNEFEAYAGKNSSNFFFKFIFEDSGVREFLNFGKIQLDYRIGLILP